MNQFPTTTTPQIRPENEGAAATWSSGGENYERISRQIADAIEHCVESLQPKPGENVLDIATGTGWTARRLAESGARVTGIDFGEEVIAAAKRFDPEGRIDFQVADAEDLPFEEGAFDVVTSTFGIMFCGSPERAATELARVCRPGGRIALATWLPRDGIFDMFQVIKKYLPVPPIPKPSPFDWGFKKRVEHLLGSQFDLEFEERVSLYCDESPDAAWTAFAEGYGPVVTLLRNLDAARAGQFQAEFLEFHERHRSGAGIVMKRPYLASFGVRRG